MEWALKGLLGLVSSLVGCCSVGVPLVVGIGSGKNSHDMQKTSIGSGNVSLPLNLTKCIIDGAQNSEVVEYGSKDKRSVCWKLESVPSDQSSEQDNYLEKYTELFKKMWDNKDSNWNTVWGEEWTSTCMKNQKKWVLNGQGSGKEYFGLCNSGETNREEWVEVEGKNSDSLKIRLCSGLNCWKNRENHESISQLSETDGNWKQVIFTTKKS